MGHKTNGGGIISLREGDGGESGGTIRDTSGMESYKAEGTAGERTDKTFVGVAEGRRTG